MFLGNSVANNGDTMKKGRSAIGERNGHATRPERSTRGERVNTAKITGAIATAIRAEYQPFIVTRPFLASKYGIAERTVGQILRRESWKHVD
jgi:hypothetical protein